MPDPEPTPARSIEAIILDLILGTDEQRPWSAEELIRELGQPVAAADAIEALYGAGLIHRSSDGFVWPTRAAVRYSQINL